MISEREIASLRRVGFTGHEIAEVAIEVEAGAATIAIDRDGTGRVLYRDGDVLEPVPEPGEEREA